MSVRYRIMMESRRCIQCGEVLDGLGRTDRKFCSETCKNNWHNAGRMAKERRYRERVSAILSANNRILRNLSSMGIRSVDINTLRQLNFNLSYSTSYQKIGSRQHYCCYEMEYDLTPSRIINLKCAID